MSSDYMSAIQASDVARKTGTSQPQTQTVNRFERNEPAATTGQDLPPAGDKAEDAEKVATAVTRISDFVQNFQRDLQFSFDEKSGQTIVKVVDSETNEVIRQIPSEETLRIAENLDSPESLMLSEMA